MPFLQRIDSVVEERRLVAVKTHLKYKEAMTQLLSESRGTKASFSLGYLNRAAKHFKDATRWQARAPYHRCGQPTTGVHCRFCRARGQVVGERLAPVFTHQVVVELGGEALPVGLYEQ